ncbi:hypothetical protein KI387_021380, partial [Taxus chinensis]
YYEDMRSFRLLDYETRDVLFQTHVQFDEHITPHDFSSSSMPPSSSHLEEADEEVVDAVDDLISNDVVTMPKL